ncbi:class I SAM-dependent methyltransferase [Paramaledivibacter caminithermalis]|jgi:ubiquinone/menaquinone biosynthesis C-methylase UbiE|uniref:Ubiquinone/menaquinone biosynthesis C-methylase UbiE n=1 Tax=Paramaledivibacter caminithermalis (strain DSM 15212 / CIP 107654 / DViRD3) TaxID=1121301 RepID=A0A1M6Q7B2_PARC5|nr:class I SAM-dependent methyltransferase [Paramaledivibacter caminithermalis]SHK16038.1 Ubiquinone/menaquinone biosynthesis C-methylase UbiE [Paramaledivibacter caminithermalis DSM 15212]
MSKIYYEYAGEYDYIFKKKNYELESDFLNEIFNQYSTLLPKTVADMGCGTSSHLFYLVQKHGFCAYGVDISENMIALSRKKFKNSKIEGSFIKSSDEKIILPEQVSLILCMFSTFNHKTNKDLALKALNNYYQNLRSNGLLVIDLMDSEHFINHFLTRFSKPCFHEGYTFTVHHKKLDNGVIEIIKNYHFNRVEDDLSFVDTFRYYIYSLEDIKKLLDLAGFKIVDKYKSFTSKTEGHRNIVIAKK